MKAFISILLFSFAFMGFRSAWPGTEDKMASFKWLIGTWTANTKDGKLMETWLPMSDSSFSGQSTLYKKTTETVPQENIELICRNKQYYFIPALPGKEPVEFRITSYNKNGFTAVNPDHDFPKRIIYTQFKKDSLHAVVDGGPGQSGKRQDYYFGKVKKVAAVKPVKKN